MGQGAKEKFAKVSFYTATKKFPEISEEKKKATAFWQ